MVGTKVLIVTLYNVPGRRQSFVECTRVIRFIKRASNTATLKIKHKIRRAKYQAMHIPNWYIVTSYGIRVAFCMLVDEASGAFLAVRFLPLHSIANIVFFDFLFRY